MRLWSVDIAQAAASPVKVSNTPITAMAVDPDTGYAWCGTADGEIGVVRWVGGRVGEEKWNDRLGQP